MQRFLILVCCLNAFTLVTSWAATGHASTCSEAYERSQATIAGGPHLPADLRVRVLCDLKTAIQNKYSLLSLKKTRIKFDSLKHLDQCIDLESKIPASNMNEFEDRALVCMASFQDSHIATMAQQARPYVVSGVFFRQMGSELLISGYDRKIIELTQKEFLARGDTRDLTQLLKPGTVVEEIDGQAPDKWTSWLRNFVNGSSAAYVESQAVRDLSYRAYSYPSSRFLVLKIRGESKTINLNWYVFPFALRDDLRDILLNKLQLRSLLPLGFSQDRPTDGYGVGFVGYDERNPLPVTALRTFINRNGTTVLQMGELNLVSATACYLQILSSDDSDTELILKGGGPGTGRLKRTEIMATLLNDCKSAGRAVIVDLRRNPGGNFVIPVSDAGLFVPSSSSLPSAFTTGRLTPHLRQVFDEYSFEPEVPLSDWDKFSLDRNYRAVKDAEANGYEHLSAIPEKNLAVHPLVRGFDHQVIVMIGPHCKSGCEIMASILSRRPHTLMVGAPTQGTGGMVQKSRLFPLAAGFRDDVYGTLQVRVPNALFGVMPAPVASGHLVPFSMVEPQILENQPLQPNPAFLHTADLDDLLNDNASWLRLLQRAIK